LAKKRDAEITIINRSGPRVAIQITEISIDDKTKIRQRKSIAHLTVTNLSGDQAKKIIMRQSKKRAVDKKPGRFMELPEAQTRDGQIR
jgi:hypothetical protein